MLTPTPRATSGSRPMITNSPVPIAKPPTPSAITDAQKWRSRSRKTADGMACGRAGEVEGVMLGQEVGGGSKRAGRERPQGRMQDCAAPQHSAPDPGFSG